MKFHMKAQLNRKIKLMVNGLELFQISSLLLRLIRVYLKWCYIVYNCIKRLPSKVDDFALRHCTTKTRFHHQKPKEIKWRYWGLILFWPKPKFHILMCPCRITRDLFEEVMV